MYPLSKEELVKPYWCLDFLRDDPRKGYVEYDINYLINQAEANNYFYNWFINAYDITFFEMLKNQHKIACLGEKLNRKYKIKGFYRSKENLNNIWYVRDSFPGKSRIDLKREKVSHPSIDLLRVTKKDFKFIKNEEYFNHLYSAKKNGFDFSKTKINYGPFKIQTIIESQGKQRVRHFKFYKNGYFKLNHPVNGDYLICIDNVRNLILELMKLNSTNNISLFLEVLGEYYHNAINWMPFAHVNNSIFMGQINVILRHNNLQSIPHSKIDIIALLSSTKNFIKIFKEYVLSYQNELVYYSWTNTSNSCE